MESIDELRQRVRSLEQTFEDIASRLEQVGISAGIYPSATKENWLRLLHRLSPREREIVRMLVKGGEAAEIARALHISVHTVRNHVRAVYKKLGVHSQLDLLRRFVWLPESF